MSSRVFVRLLAVAAASTFAIALLATQANAAVVIASDNAGNAAYNGDDSNGGNDGNPANNTNSWVSGDNGGFGFNPWNLYTSQSGFGGRFIYTSTENGDGSDNGNAGGV